MWGACTRAGAGGRPTRSRGKLFFRLVQQAVAIDPAPYESLVRYARMP